MLLAATQHHLPPLSDSSFQALLPLIFTAAALTALSADSLLVTRGKLATAASLSAAQLFDGETNLLLQNSLAVAFSAVARRIELEAEDLTEGDERASLLGFVRVAKSAVHGVMAWYGCAWRFRAQPAAKTATAEANAGSDDEGDKITVEGCGEREETEESVEKEKKEEKGEKEKEEEEATSGLGKEAATALASLGTFHVVIGCHSFKRGYQVLPLDLSRPASVVRFCHLVRSRLGLDAVMIGAEEGIEKVGEKARSIYGLLKSNSSLEEAQQGSRQGGEEEENEGRAKEGSQGGGEERGLEEEAVEEEEEEEEEGEEKGFLWGQQQQQWQTRMAQVPSPMPPLCLLVNNAGILSPTASHRSAPASLPVDRYNPSSPSPLLNGDCSTLTTNHPPPLLCSRSTCWLPLIMNPLCRLLIGHFSMLATNYLGPVLFTPPLLPLSYASPSFKSPLVSLAHRILATNYLGPVLPGPARSCSHSACCPSPYLPVLPFPIMNPLCSPSVLGHRSMLATNYLGPVLLTLRLLPLMGRRAPSLLAQAHGGNNTGACGEAEERLKCRIVNVTSFTHRSVRQLCVSDVASLATGAAAPASSPPPLFYPAASIYQASKLCLLLFSLHLQRLLQSDPSTCHISVVPIDPGMVRTAVLRELPSLFAATINTIFSLLGLCLLPHALVPLFLCASTAPQEQVAGKYLFGTHAVPLPPSPLAQDTSLSNSLWRTTQDLLTQWVSR
ncbi:unnamed protein product [Closterium sp. Naga37s-1]|nr:unnamed protein product [Closterium sp. Naga37s-1]